MHRLPAYPVYLALRFGFSLAFALFATVSGVYRVNVAELDPLQLVLIGTALELSVFLFEVPTGIVADVYSRRLSIVVGYAIIGAGFILEGAFTIFATMLLAQVIWGIGYTFTSGATDAWIADEHGETGLAGIYLRGSQAGTLGGILGIFGGIGLGSVQTNYGMYAGGGLFILAGLALALLMPERNFTRVDRAEHGTFGTMAQTFRGGIGVVRGRPILLSLLAITAIAGASSEAFDRLREAHILRSFDFPFLDSEPVAWFGGLSLVGMVISLGATELVRRRIRTERQRDAVRALLVIDAILMLGVIAFGLAGSFALALSTWLLIFLMREINEPIFTALVNRSIDPRVRATVLSMTGQANAFGQFTGGPALGAVGSIFSIRAAIVATGLVMAPVLWLYGRAMREPERALTSSTGDADDNQS
jgi:DHA3 family tetracycline resistance protein-like MFS transporter